MIRSRCWIAVASCSMLLSSSYATAQTKSEKQILALMSRTPDDLMGLVTVSGDSMDPAITITTRGVTAMVSKGLLMSTTTENSFLRGFLDRKTGIFSAQVYHRATSGGSSPPSYDRATFEGADGLKEVEADQIGYEPSCGRYGCTHRVDVVFPVDFPSLEASAATFDAAKPSVTLRYRLFSRTGQTIDEAFPPNEVAAFVAVVKRERDALKVLK